MVNIRGLGRIGLLAVGLGIGAAVAFTPGVAAADSSSPFDVSWVDSLVSPDAAQTSSGLDIAISINGTSLLDVGNATATSDTGDIAIAIGSGATASATDGTGNFAMADGTDSNAYAGFYAEGAGGNNDFATAIGTDSDAFAYAGNQDSATAMGTDAVVFAGNGNSDTASVVDPTGTDGSDASALNGDNNFASVFGDGDAASASGWYNVYPGGNNIAEVFGTDSSANAGSEPFTASGNFDLAAAFGDTLHATATGANYLVDIQPTDVPLDNLLSSLEVFLASL